MYDQELQDNRRPQSSPSQSNIPSNLPKLNFNYDNGSNTKSISQLPSQSAHFGLPIRPSHPAGHPTSTSRPGSRPSSSASVTSSPSIVSISPPLTTTNTSHIQALNIPTHNHNIPQGPPTGAAASVAPTGPPTEFTYTPVSGFISRPHPQHQNHSSNQDQTRNQSRIPADTSQNPNTSSGIPHVPGSVVHNTQHSSRGPPPATAPAVLVGPASGSSGSGSGKHLVGSSGSSNSFNGFQNAMNIGYFTQHRRASGSALGSHILHNGLTASPQSANISPVSLHRVPPSVGGPNFSGLGPSEGYAARSSANNEHAIHPHMSPRQTHRAPPAPTSSAQSQHALPTPSIPFVPTPPLTTAQLSQGLHLIPSYPSHPPHPTSSNSASTAATAQTATQAILSTTQRTLEHTWNTILTSVDSEVAKLHTAHAGQIRVWADYVDGVRKESDTYKLRMESFQRDADRIRKEREMYRLKSKDLENQIDEIRRRAESQRRPEVPESVAHSQVELQEGRRKYEGQEDGSHDTEQTSNDLIDRLRRERDVLKIQVAGLATGSHPQNHSRSHSEHLQKLQNEHLSLSASYNTLLNAHSQLQATHTSLLATHNHLQITHTALRSTYDSCQTTYTALRREFEDLLEREEKARIKLGIAEESLKGERERAFELDEARKREKKGRKEREKEVEELRGKVYDLERHSTNGVRKETPDTFKETRPEENRAESGQSQHESQVSTPIRPPSPQLRRSPHRQDVVNFDADDSVLPISPPPTGPSMLSPQPFSPPVRPTLPTSPPRRVDHPVASASRQFSETRNDPQNECQDRRSRSVMSAEDLSGSLHREPESGHDRSAYLRPSSNAPSVVMSQTGSKAPSLAGSKASSPIRDESEIVNSFTKTPSPLLPPVEPVTLVMTPMARKESRSPFTEYRPLPRSDTQEWQQDLDVYRPLSTSDMHPYQKTDFLRQDLNSPTSARGPSLGYGNEEKAPESILQVPTSRSRLASTSYSQAPSRPHSAAESPRPSSTSLLLESGPSTVAQGHDDSEKMTTTGRSSRSVPRLDMGVLDQNPATNPKSISNPDSGNPMSTSPVVTPSPSSNSSLLHNQWKQMKTEAATREIGVIKEGQDRQEITKVDLSDEVEEGEERESARIVENPQRPDSIHRLLSPSPFAMYGNNSHHDQRQRGFVHVHPDSSSTSSRPWLATSVEHRRTYASSPNSSPRLHGTHITPYDSGIANGYLSRNSMNHLKRKGNGNDERDTSSSASEHLYPRDIDHSHPQPHKLVKVMRDGQVVASPVDFDGRNGMFVERRRDGRMERHGELSYPQFHTPSYSYPSVKTQGSTSHMNGMHRLSQRSSTPPQSAVPMSISPVSPSSTVAPVPPSQSNPQSTVEQSHQGHHSTAPPTDSHENFDTPTNAKPSSKRILITPSHAHPVQPYPGLPMKPVDSAIQLHPGLPKKPFFEPVDTSKQRTNEKARSDGWRNASNSYPGRSGSDGWYTSTIDTNGNGTWKSWATAPPISNGHGQDQTDQNTSGPGAAPIKQLSFKHIDLLYETIGGEYICRECRASSATNLTKPKSFPTSSPSFTEIFAHYSESHKAREEEVLKYSAVKLQEQLLLKRGNSLQLNTGRGGGGKRKVGGKKGSK
ncbi:hypothetical protein C8R41DRAFT_293221 [Lentinula lateritia]|uniref:Uncharacterized protein n=1 Tax=Lentinula lateritia TaxID=40482 RepID=A0ABQ8VIE8_9AGAR|nr:hypothetical protein C8R41DRAFT_293221 [Lentinula lateritia]